MTTSSQGPAARLDTFVDAAFAFAVSLIVIDRRESTPTFADMVSALEMTPAFAMGFALIMMFWHGHVRWRRLSEGQTSLGALLTFLLTFLVLVYVYPLRQISLLSGGETGDNGLDFASLCTIYGVGYFTMSATVAALFLEALRRTTTAPARAIARGEICIWAIQGSVGLLSATLAQLPATTSFSPWAYALLGVAVPIFAWRYDWSGESRLRPTASLEG